MRVSANLIGIALCFIVAAAIVLVGPSLFGRTQKMDEIMSDIKAPRITDDGRPRIKKL